MPRILAFAGSARRDSVNQKLLHAACAVARELGAEVDEVSLADFEMPLYNGDLEENDGVPEAARSLRERIEAADALLLACPEYNGSVTPLFKNTLDWTSRPDGEAKMLQAYRGKVAGLLSASPGALGGMRGLVHVRAILGGIGMYVVPSQCTVAGALQAFDDEGHLTDERQARHLRSTVQELVEATAKLRGGGA